MSSLWIAEEYTENTEKKLISQFLSQNSDHAIRWTCHVIEMDGKILAEWKPSGLVIQTINNGLYLLHLLRFSLDVTATMLVSLNKGTAVMLVPQTDPPEIELYSYANVFFCFGWKLCSLITWEKTPSKFDSLLLFSDKFAIEQKPLCIIGCKKTSVSFTSFKHSHAFWKFVSKVSRVIVVSTFQLNCCCITRSKFYIKSKK